MTMFDRDSILEGASLNPAVGLPSTSAERALIDYEVFRDQSQANSDLAAVDRAYGAYVDDLEKTTGERLALPIERYGLKGNKPFVSIRQAEALFEQDVRSLAERFDGVKVKTRDDILQEIGQERADQRERQADITRRTVDFHVSAAGFGGSAAGAITDPVVIGSLFLGAPFSAGILRTALIEGGIGIASEIPIQTQVQLGRRKFGEEPSLSEALQAIAAAGAGGFLLGGLVKAGVKSVGGVRQLLAKSKELPESARTSEVRSAETYLERAVEAEDASPFADTPQGKAAHAERLTAADLALREGRVADLPPAGARIADEGQVDAPPPGDDPLSQTLAQAKQIARDRIQVDEQQRAVAEALAPLLEDDTALAALYRDLKAKPERAESLLGFLRGAGGLRDEGDELLSLGVTARTLPGLLRREGGQTLDDAALAAQQAGFFPGRDLEAGDRVTVRDFLDAVAEEVNGNRVFRLEDQARQLDEDALQEIREGLTSAGLDVDRLSEGEFRGRLQDTVRAIVERDRGAEAARMGRAGAEAADIEERIALMSEEDAFDEADVRLRYEGREDEVIAIETDDGVQRMTVRQMLDEIATDEEDLAALKLCTLGAGRG